MKKLSYLVLFIYLPLFAYGQRTSWGLGFLPQMTFSMTDIDSELKSFPQFSYVIGASYYFDIGPKIQLSSGVGLRSKRTQFKDYSPTTFDELFPEPNEEFFDSNFEFNHKLIFLNLPLRSRLKLVGEVNHFYCKLGFNFLLKFIHGGYINFNQSKTSSIKVDETSFQSTPNFLFIPEFGLGYEFKYSKKIKIFIEVANEYALSPLYLKASSLNLVQSSSKTRFYNLGMLLGIRFL